LHLDIFEQPARNGFFNEPPAGWRTGRVSTKYSILDSKIQYLPYLQLPWVLLVIDGKFALLFLAFSIQSGCGMFERG
jgi:hypothetical protein